MKKLLLTIFILTIATQANAEANLQKDSRGYILLSELPNIEKMQFNQASDSEENLQAPNILNKKTANKFATRAVGWAEFTKPNIYYKFCGH